MPLSHMAHAVPELPGRPPRRSALAYRAGGPRAEILPSCRARGGDAFAAQVPETLPPLKGRYEPVSSLVVTGSLRHGLNDQRGRPIRRRRHARRRPAATDRPTGSLHRDPSSERRCGTWAGRRVCRPGARACRRRRFGSPFRLWLGPNRRRPAVSRSAGIRPHRQRRLCQRTLRQRPFTRARTRPRLGGCWEVA
jgi:hypothetical protein